MTLRSNIKSGKTNAARREVRSASPTTDYKIKIHRNSSQSPDVSIVPLTLVQYFLS